MEQGGAVGRWKRRGWDGDCTSNIDAVITSVEKADGNYYPAASAPPQQHMYLAKSISRTSTTTYVPWWINQCYINGQRETFTNSQIRCLSWTGGNCGRDREAVFGARASLTQLPYHRSHHQYAKKLHLCKRHSSYPTVLIFLLLANSVCCQAGCVAFISFYRLQVKMEAIRRCEPIIWEWASSAHLHDTTIFRQSRKLLWLWTENTSHPHIPTHTHQCVLVRLI